MCSEQSLAVYRGECKSWSSIVSWQHWNNNWLAGQYIILPMCQTYTVSSVTIHVTDRMHNPHCLYVVAINFSLPHPYAVIVAKRGSQLFVCWKIHADIINNVGVPPHGGMQLNLTVSLPGFFRIKLYFIRVYLLCAPRMRLYYFIQTLFICTYENIKE